MRMRTVALVLLAVVLGVPAAVIATVAAVYSASKEVTGTLAYGDEQREYLLHTPKGYDGTKAVPLVISLHGAMGWPALQRDITGWNELADEKGFIVVYPAGRGTGPKAWFMHGSDDPPRMPDVRFIADLLAQLQARWRIDARRIYVEGLSNGGGMAHVLACTMPQRVAAVGVVAAAQSLPPGWCRDTTPVPAIVIHGNADTIVPYAGGPSPIAPRPFPAVPEWTGQWARRNGCSGNAVTVKVAADVTRTDYGGCPPGAEVQLFTVEDGGHQWPGGRRLPEWLLGRRTQSIHATRLLWGFFEQHPRR